MHVKALERTKRFTDSLRTNLACQIRTNELSYRASRTIQKNADLFCANIENRTRSDERVETEIKSSFFSHYLGMKRTEQIWGLNPGTPFTTSFTCTKPLQELSDLNARPSRLVLNSNDPEYQSSLMQPSMRDALLALLRQTVRTLEENNIRYWISGGTLLGAVRHKGFIPWDDDIDLCVDMSDESKLLQAFQFPYFLEFNPIFGYKTYSRDEGANSLLPLTCYGIFIDFFLMEPTNCAYRQAFQPAREAWPREMWLPQHLFPLKEYEFEGLRVKGPYQPHEYLQQMYGADCLTCGRIPPVLHGRHISVTPLEVPMNIWS